MRNERTASEKERLQPRRKIEQQMIQAIRDGRAWHSGNTQVTYHPSECNAGLCSVFLHGNRIALYDRTQSKAVAVNATFKDWPTRTTVSRLRALGINAAIRKGKPTIDGKEI